MHVSNHADARSLLCTYLVVIFAYPVRSMSAARESKPRGRLSAEQVPSHVGT